MAIKQGVRHMGRYYDGDISGKFWFAVQPSDAAEQFGAEQQEPSTIEYAIERTDFETKGKETMKNLRTALGSDYHKLANFFDKNDSYNNERLEKETGMTGVEEKLQYYADIKFAEKIQAFFDEDPETDTCYFTAET